MHHEIENAFFFFDKKRQVLTQFVEALSSLGDLSGAPLQLTLQPLAQVQDANDPPQEVTGYLGRREDRRGGLTCGKLKPRAICDCATH